MRVQTLLINNDIRRADNIANGDRSFDIIAKWLDVQVGDLIHYNTVASGNRFRHDVVNMLYTVTDKEEIKECAIINVKPTISWTNYVRSVIESAFESGTPCSFRFYGVDNIEQSSIKSYNGESIAIVSANGNEIHRSVSEIIEINRIQ